MARFFSVLLWTAIFLLILLATDQLLVRMPATHPAHVAVADFYRNLRSRIVDLAKGAKSAPAPAKPAAPPKGKATTQRPPASIEGIIEQHQVRSPAPPSSAALTMKPASQAGEPAPRYVYADAAGELHFAATLAEIPEQYRKKARMLGE